MPLYKKTQPQHTLLPADPPPMTTAQQSQHQQLERQARRRTLQTISELSPINTATVRFAIPSHTTEETRPRARGVLPPGGSKTTDRSKRQSMPQFHAARGEGNFTQRIEPRATTSVTRAQIKEMNDGLIARYEAGWNARRERARMDSEYASSWDRLGSPRSSSSSASSSPSPSTWRTTNNAAPVAADPSSRPLSVNLPLLRRSESQQLLKMQGSQSYLLRSTPSANTLASRSDGWTSVGESSHSSWQHGYDAEGTEGVSGMAGAMKSQGVSSPRRSGSGSSSGGSMASHQSHPGQGPFPHGFHLASQTHAALGARPSVHFGAQEMPYRRSWSFPTQTIGHTPPYTHILGSPTGNNHDPTATQPQTAYSKRNVRGNAADNRPLSIPNTTSLSPIYAHSRSRSRSVASPPPPSPTPPTHSSPPPAYAARPHHGSLAVRPPGHEETQFTATNSPRASIQERVRRANELEQEKERQLQALGKGMANEKECRVLGSGAEGEIGAGKRRSRMVERHDGREKKGCIKGVFGGLFGRRRKGNEKRNSKA